MRTRFCSNSCNGSCEDCGGNEEPQIEIVSDVPRGFHEVTIAELTRHYVRTPTRADWRERPPTA